jgi:SAM-dependent methyltransferase
MTVVASSPAEIYDRRFVPALFAPWGPVVAKAAGVSPGMRVLDVGCGTGALALAAAGIVGADGEVVGLDPNPEMLAVASAKPVPVRWVPGRAEALPFEEASFDAVASQFAMMFFEDHAAALREMHRVVRPGRWVAVAVCGALDEAPGYVRFVALLDRLFGRETGDAFRAPFVLGGTGRLGEIAAAAGVEGASAEKHVGEVRFASVEDLVSTERACAWTLGGLLDRDQFDRLLREARTELASFVTADGTVAFAMPALILSFRRT